MQTVYNLVEIPFQVEKKFKKDAFRITDRDLEILAFILEMKFSTIEDIHSKFFKVTRTGERSSCLRWARERIANLVKSDFLKTAKDVCHKTLFVVTMKGYFYLRNSRQNNYFSKPLLEVDGRTYDHDQKVIQIRTQLEESRIVRNWISERQLGEIEEFRKYLPTEFRPDAIYETLSGEKFAFELEVARKSKERYQQKVKRYIQLITDQGSEPIFTKVHFVCEKENVMRLIQDQTELFGPYFKFELVSNIFNRGSVT